MSKRWLTLLFLLFTNIAITQNVDSLKQVFRSNAADSLRFDAGYELTYAMLDVSTEAVSEYAYPTYSLSKKLPPKYQLSAAYQMAYLFTGYDYDSAFKYILITDSLNQMLGKQEFDGLIFDLYAQFYESIRDFETAIAYYEAELELAREEKDTSSLSLALNNLAGLNFELSRLESALLLYQESLELSQLVKKNTLITLANIANVNLELKKLDEAREYLDKAKIETSRANENWEREYFHRVAGNYYMDVDSLALAEVEYKEALRINELSLNLEDKAHTLKSLGQLLTQQKRYSEALQVYDEAFKISESESLESLEASIVYGIQEVHAKVGDFKKAHELLETYLELNKNLQANEAIQKVTALETRYTVEKEQEERDERSRRAREKQKREDERNANIQSSGIFIGLMLLVALLLAASKFTVPQRYLHGFTFFIFVLFFEFLLVIADPWIELLADGSPLLKLLANSVIALLIIPFHRILENAVVKRLIK